MSPVTPLARGRSRVLIVDDQRQNRDLLEVMLSEEGFLLQTAANGEVALALVEQEPPDLVLLDVMMPGIDGYQVAARIKQGAASKHTAIIMVSALGNVHAKKLGLAAGADDFVSKPVDRQDLLTRVRKLLRARRGGGADGP